MKNIQVRVEDYLKDEADKLFKSLGTTTTEAIKIFLKMSLNKGGFPFLILRESRDLLDRIENRMLPLNDEEVRDSFVTVEGRFFRDSEFEAGVFDEVILLKGMCESYAGDDLIDLAEAHIKIVDRMKEDLWIVADADSGDYELVVSHLVQTDLLDDVCKVGILDEYFVFSRQVSAETRVELFKNHILSYLRDRDVDLLAFMNYGFWRTEQFEEQKATLSAFKECGIEVVSRGKTWGEMINFIDLRNLV